MSRFAYILLTLSLAMLACVSVLPPRPALEWDTSPEAVVIEAYVVGGMVPSNFYENYIPEVRVFGDGRIVWVEWQSGSRTVLEGQLTEAELRAVLEEFSSAGFFGWENFYEPDSMIYDAGTAYLRVNLLSISKSVGEYVEGAPAQYDVLWARVANGADATSTPFVPENGYLTATPLNGTGFTATHTWPEEATGLKLSEVTAGQYVQGEALATAWAIINENQYATIESSGALYYIAVQIPGISYETPP
ncbi:MAG: hypothetical protein JNL09_03100 [Anaerolineales bacterium]|nr:hypothetical protein [Anaerolineales bacterium]